MNKQAKRSSRLSYWLRHSLLPETDGWVAVDKLVTEHGFTADEIDELVRIDAKNRFEYSDDGTKIRACQGHSEHVDIRYEPAEPPAVLYHGTAVSRLESIKAEGIKPMARKYVHLSTSVPQATTVGARHGEPVVLEIDAAAMRREGVTFFLAHNGVWLVGHVAPEYFRVV